MEALLASSLGGLSWEVAYHARWIAPDAIVMQFGALALMFLILSQGTINRRKPELCLGLASAAAGLACGTKYQAGLLMLPILIAAYTRADAQNALLTRFPWGSFVRVFVIFGLFYLMTTPGTVVEPYEFIHDVMFEMRHYQGGHWGHTVNPGVHHFSLMFVYLFFAVFSRYAVIAVMFSIMAAVGVWALAKEERRTAVIFLSMPVCYIVYMSFQSVMIVRNLLILIPFLSILAARGATFLQKNYFERGVSRFAFRALLVVSLLTNALWLGQATDSVRSRGRANDLRELARYLNQHEGTRFLLSSRVSEELSSWGYPIPGNVVHEVDERGIAVFYSSDAAVQKASWPSNRWRYYTLLDAGPHEVNFDYYPDWIGYDRVVILPARKALELGVPLQ